MELKLIEIAQAIGEVSKYPAGAVVITILGIRSIPYLFPKNNEDKKDCVKKEECHSAMDGLNEHIDDKFSSLREKMDEDARGVRLKMDELSSSLLDITRNVEWRKR